ncbi:MAG: transcription elongation factor GreA [Leptospiraceae bacterium]|nr:transcription elongation factor GreA [Leptospiraceae bacterium]
MSETNIESGTQSALIKKIETQINDDRVFKDLSQLQLSRFTQLDELLEAILPSPERARISELLLEVYHDEPHAPGARYLLGLMDFEDNKDDSAGYLRSLIDDCVRHTRWKVVEHIADRMLAQDPENRSALRAKVRSVEQLRGKKETKPFIKTLAAIDHNNPDVHKSYAMSILEEEPNEALKLLKKAIESYARQKDYRNVDDIWPILVDRAYDDLAFFEKIERVIVGNREKTRMAAYLMSLLEPHKQSENWSTVIEILKKILDYEPASSKARSDLVRAYRMLYAEHSLLDEFLKISGLTNHRKAPGPCIAEFERNIVFDVDNYVHHRTRGVGKIKLIDNEQMIVDFRDNPDQRMSIQMAISSLRPLGPDHIWVKLYEAPDETKALFNDDISGFFELLLNSFGSTMVLAEIKQEIVGTFLESSEWSKWWSKTRTALKKDPKFGFNPRKKDELLLRENPISLAEELMLKFQSLQDWDKKLDVALQVLKEEEAHSAAQSTIQFYKENESSKESLKQLHSYLYLELATRAIQDEIPGRILKDEAVQQSLQDATIPELLNYCRSSLQIEFKRELVNLYIKCRSDYPEILKGILFEVPIKINKYALSELEKHNCESAIQEFFEEALMRYRENPEIFLWCARNILQDSFKSEWLQHTKEDLMLQVFRLLKPLNRIEAKGTRLKNSAIDVIFATSSQTVEDIMQHEVLVEIVMNADQSTLRRMNALFRDVPYVSDAHKENFQEFLKTVRPELEIQITDLGDETEGDVAEVLFPEDGIILVTAEALQKRRQHYDHLINVEMPQNSRDIGEAQEKGDLRENAEYKAAMERQTQLRAEITRVSAELKQAREIDPAEVKTEIVRIGTKVLLQGQDGELNYAILGPWDADTEQGIISYASPLGKALIGKQAGESASLDDGQSFQIQSIASFF